MTAVTVLVSVAAVVVFPNGDQQRILTSMGGCCDPDAMTGAAQHGPLQAKYRHSDTAWHIVGLAARPAA